MSPGAARTSACSTVSLLLVVSAFGQSGVVFPRGVVNSYSQEPAPSPVAPGGLISISGIGLGSAQVTIGGKTATVVSSSDSLIVAQVPSDVTPGFVDVVVGSGRAVRIPVLAAAPSVKSLAGNGFGQVSGALSAGALTVAASSLGAGNDLRVFIGGVLAQATTALSSTAAGESDITLQVPSTAQPGDTVVVRTGSQISNLTTFQTASSTSAAFLPLPQGAPAIQFLTGSDLRGRFVAASAMKGSDGCWPSYLLDFNQASSSAISGCVSGNFPFAASGQGVTLGALIGSAPSSTVRLFRPDGGGNTDVALSSTASQLMPGTQGSLTASLPTNPPTLARVDESTGNVTYGPDMSSVAVDLGGGLSKLAAQPVLLDSGEAAVLVGDDASAPTQVKFAVVDASGKPRVTTAFPSGWTPLLAPLPPSGPSGPPGSSGSSGPTLAGQIPRVISVWDASSNSVYVLSRSADGGSHALVGFSAADGSSRVLTFPNNWYASACSPFIPLFSLPVSRKLVLAGATTNNTSYQDSCQGTAFIAFDSVSGNASAVAAPAPFAVNGGGLQTVKEFVVASNSSNQSPGDTLFVFDGFSNSVFTITVPNGVPGFAGFVPAPALGALMGTGISQQPGDSGLILFDLVNATATALAVPSGFASVELTGVFPATRKAVARAVNANGTGSQFFIYDLATLDVTPVNNPDGVVFVGSLPGSGPTRGGPISSQFHTGRLKPDAGITIGGPGGAGPSVVNANLMANSVEALCFDANSNQTGIMSFRVP